MADVSITPANVVPGSNTKFEVVDGGGSVLGGYTVYKDTTDGNKIKACDADVQASAVCAGIVASTGGTNQKLVIYTKGDVTLGSGNLTVGTTYCVSTNAGGIAPEADLLTGDYKSILGVAITSSVLRLNINNSGVAEA